MTLVVDASVALAWLLEDEDSAYADAVLERLRTAEAFAPHLWGLEVANGLVAAERCKRIEPEETESVQAALLSLPIAVDPVSRRRAFAASYRLAQTHGLSAYDAAYLELAQRLGAELATLDRPLRAAARAAGVVVVEGPDSG